VSEARDRVLSGLCERIDAVAGDGLTMVAIDGVDGAGKTMFADALAARLEADDRVVVRASVDGFHNRRAVRYQRGKDSPEGFFRDSYDYDALQTALLFPARIGQPFRTAVFDVRTNRKATVNPMVVPLPAVLVFDGIFLNRPELRDEWDLSVFLDVPFAVSYARMAKRDGCDSNPEAESNRRYYEGQQLYLRECRPRDEADVVIDYADVDLPLIVRG
jgi:uridine kinase